MNEVEYIIDTLGQAVDALVRKTGNAWDKLICLMKGHWEHRMNKVVKRGTTDAAGGSDLICYTPVYCVRCGKSWKEPG